MVVPETYHRRDPPHTDGLDAALPKPNLEDNQLNFSDEFAKLAKLYALENVKPKASGDTSKLNGTVAEAQRCTVSLAGRLGSVGSLSVCRRLCDRHLAQPTTLFENAPPRVAFGASRQTPSGDPFALLPTSVKQPLFADSDAMPELTANACDC